MAAGAIRAIQFTAGGGRLVFLAGRGRGQAWREHHARGLLRWGFAAYMLEAICDVALTLLFYVVFRVVHGELALAAVFFRLIGTAGFAVSQVLFFASLSTLESAVPLHAFAPDQRNALAMLLVQFSHDGQTVFTMLYGVGTLVFGRLIWRSGFLPPVMGVLVMLAAGGLSSGPSRGSSRPPIRRRGFSHPRASPSSLFRAGWW